MAVYTTIHTDEAISLVLVRATNSTSSQNDIYLLNRELRGCLHDPALPGCNEA